MTRPARDFAAARRGAFETGCERLGDRAVVEPQSHLPEVAKQGSSGVNPPFAGSLHDDAERPGQADAQNRGGCACFLVVQDSHRLARPGERKDSRLARSEAPPENIEIDRGRWVGCSEPLGKSDPSGVFLRPGQHFLRHGVRDDHPDVARREEIEAPNLREGDQRGRVDDPDPIHERLGRRPRVSLRQSAGKAIPRIGTARRRSPHAILQRSRLLAPG